MPDPHPVDIEKKPSGWALLTVIKTFIRYRFSFVNFGKPDSQYGSGMKPVTRMAFKSLQLSSASYMVVCPYQRSPNM